MTILNKHTFGKKAGGGGYLPSCIRAYEYNETSSPLVDSINGYYMDLGSLMTVGGGIVSTTGVYSATGNRAIGNDTTKHMVVGTPITVEVYVEFLSGGSIPNICTFRGPVAGVGILASTINGYRQFIVVAQTGWVKAKFNAPNPYAFNTPYHLVYRYNGNVDVSDPGNHTLQINGVVYSGAYAANVGIQPDGNFIGNAAATTEAEQNQKYLRVYDAELSDAEALQLYTNRDIEPTL